MTLILLGLVLGFAAGVAFGVWVAMAIVTDAVRGVKDRIGFERLLIIHGWRKRQ